MSRTGRTPHEPRDRPLPRGPQAIAPEAVAADQRRRLLAALPETVAEHGLHDFTAAQVVRRAAVGRSYFYRQFDDKWDCFAAACEAAQERLLGVLTLRCYTRSGLRERVEAALSAALRLLASEPALARLVVVGAPAAGGEIAARHHQWLRRCGSTLQLAAIGAENPAPRSAVATAIAGGVASRVAQRVLAGEAERLPELTPDLVTFILCYYPPSPASPPATSGQPSAGAA